MKRESRTQLLSLRNKLQKAIKAKCLDCSAGQMNEVKLCPVNNCSLWLFRFGRSESVPLLE